MRNCPHSEDNPDLECYECKRIALDEAIEVLKFYAAEWTNKEMDELIRQGGFFPYGIDETDQGRDAGEKARAFLWSLGIEVRNPAGSQPKDEK